MEIWKEVKGFEGIYQVNNFGLVIRVNKPNKKTLKPYLSAGGYSGVSLSKKGKARIFYVHRIVAETFIPNPENKKQVNHINGIKTDNRVENLEWNTSKENIKHSYDFGLAHIGEMRAFAKLSEEQAYEIKHSISLLSNREMALIYGVSAACISKIRNGRLWKHV